MAEFRSKWDIGEILELKDSDEFIGKVIAVQFCQEGEINYLLRRTDGVVVHCHENELEIK